MSEVLVLISGILNTVNYIRPGHDIKPSGPTINSPSSWPHGVFAIDREVSHVNTVPA